jgi:hypothetical protein
MDNIAFEAGNQSLDIFLLSTGSDPTPLVEEADKKAKMNLHTVYMGQGSEKITGAYIVQSKAKGE